MSDTKPGALTRAAEAFKAAKPPRVLVEAAKREYEAIRDDASEACGVLYSIAEGASDDITAGPSGSTAKE